MKETTAASDVPTIHYRCGTCQLESTVELSTKLAPGRFIVREGRWRAECRLCGAHTVERESSIALRDLEVIGAASPVN